MVEGGRVFLLRLDFIETLYPPVDSIIDRLVKPLDHGSAGGAFFPNNLDPRRVNQLSHDSLFFFDRVEMK
jgi:hypothetical protein